MSPEGPLRATGKTALVTGATSGIGEELARILARDGYDLVLVARNETRLQEVGADLGRRHGIGARVLPADLARPGSAAEIAARVRETSAGVDLLVNNAGRGTFGTFARTSLEAELAILQLNVVSLTHLTKLLLPGMVSRGSGGILNVASTAAFLSGPLMAVYYASKAYVLSFSEALACELRGTGVTVTALCPGPTRTAFQTSAGMEGSRLVRSRVTMDAAAVARIGYEGFKKGKTVVVPGLANKMMVQAVRLLPRRAVARLVRAAQRLDPG